MIPGIPKADSQRLLELHHTYPDVQQVVLYSSRALERQRAGSDIELCLEAPSMELGELLNWEQLSTTCSCHDESISSYAT